MSVLRSEEFDDIYFSPDDGLAETRYTFLQGNNLSERFKKSERFTIIESGFGTGLNFLAAIKLFLEKARADAQLDFISFEKYPLSVEQFKPVLEHWADDLDQEHIDRLAELYPARIFAFHTLNFSSRIRLRLIFDDMNLALPKLNLPLGVDAWFLDGFAPSKNPDMWSDTLYENMQRLSRSGATAATFTAAGVVKRGLLSAGFEVEKIKGYGRKREMIKASYQCNKDQFVTSHAGIKRVAIIGAGLAGASCARRFGESGIKVSVYDKADKIAAYASGNDTGLYNPRLGAERNEHSAFFSAGYAALITQVNHAAEAVKHTKCGTLHLAVDEDKEKRLRSADANWEWHEDHMQYVSAQQATEIAGVSIDKSALYLPDGGYLSPHELCKFWLNGAEMHLGQDTITIQQLEDERWLVNDQQYDAVILACAIDILSYEQTSWLPLNTVRGQTSYIDADEHSKSLKANLCYGGYISAGNGEHVIGASFQRWHEHSNLLEQDDTDNIEKLLEAVPSLKSLSGSKIKKSWAGLRTSLKDRFPAIGSAPDYRSWLDGEEKNISNLYVFSALGSHGMVSALTGAQLIFDMMMDLPYALPYDTVQQLSPDRFLARAKKKGQL